jgi:hypothetical protein
MSDNNYGFEPTLDGLNTINSDSSTVTDFVCDTIQINVSGNAPTVSALSNDTNIATTAWVTNHANATYVTLAGVPQTISSEKTFTNANTYITGNTVTNNIVSASATSNINIGSALTTGDINLGSSAVATGVALNWGGASNSGNLTFTGGSFTLTSSGIYTQRCGATFGMTIADTQTSGILNIGTNASRTGEINIGTGTSTAKNITIGTGSGGTTLLRGASATVTIGNSGTLTLSSATGGTVNMGTAMTTGSITIGGGASSTANIFIGSSQATYTGSIAIGTVVTGNAPITIGSSTSTTQTALHNALTTFKNLVVVDNGILLRLGFSATGLTMGKTGTNEITFKLIDSSDILYFNDSTGTNIMYMSSTEIVNTKQTTFNNDILIAQSNYTQPFSSDTQLGYTDTETTLTDPMTSTLTARSDFLLPSKGVWLIICGYEWGANATNTIQNKEIVLSTTSGGSTQVAYGLQYYEEIDDSVGAINTRQQGTLTGVVTVTASTTIYVNARSAVGSGANTELRTNVSWTRIG